MKKFVLLITAFVLFSASCTAKKGYEADTYKMKPGNQMAGAADWYRSAVIYHLWVKAFNDGRYDDGIGDLKGITKKMGYLKDLGITAIWLSPIFDCQKKSGNIHGYDVLDFYTINDRFGTKEDLEDLLDEAHDNGIRVIFDFMLNHTSTKSKWFTEHPEWYVWSPDAAEGYTLPWGGGNPNNVWRFKRGQYFYSAFATDELADLNYKYQDASGNFVVQDEMMKVAKFWLDRGFDGIRVDAARYIVENGPGLQADQPETHEFFVKLRSMLNGYEQKTKSAKVMLAEAWVDESRVGAYFGDGNNEFQMCFDFMAAQRIPSAIDNEDPSALTSLWQYEDENYPTGYQNANFQSNHDNLVSRPATVFEGDKNKELLSAAITIFGPGTPVLYYGNELGMEGEMGNDANLRTSVNWEEVNNLESDKNSILSWYKYLLKAKNSYPALSGTFTILDPSETTMLAALREKGDEKIVVLMNFSEDVSSVTVDLGSKGIAADSAIKPILGTVKEKKLNGTVLEVSSIPAFGTAVIYLSGPKAPKKPIAGYPN